MNFVPIIYRRDDDDGPPEPPPPLWLVGVALCFLAIVIYFAFANVR